MKLLKLETAASQEKECPVHLHRHGKLAKTGYRQQAPEIRTMCKSDQSEQFGRIVFGYVFTQLILDRNGVEILQPAFRRNHWPVGSKQHLLFQNRVAIAYQYFLKILGRPATKIDLDIGLVLRNRQRLFLPGEGGMCKHYFQVWKIDCHLIHVHRVGVLEPHTVAAWHS